MVTVCEAMTTPAFRKRKRHVRVPMPSRNTTLVEHAAQGIERVSAHELTVIKSRVLVKFGRHVEHDVAKFAKGIETETVSEESLREFLASLTEGTLQWSDEARATLRQLLGAVAEERSTVALDSLSDYLNDGDLASMVTQANKIAIAWAREREGSLITEVSDTTRNAINEMTATAIESGWTNRELADELERAWEFSPERALLIARTEPTFAETAGTLAGYQTSGAVDGKGWSGEDPCDLCQGNEDDGIIALDDTFSSGDDGPPGHPRCECTLYAAVLVGGESDETSDDDGT